MEVSETWTKNVLKVGQTKLEHSKSETLKTFDFFPNGNFPKVLLCQRAKMKKRQLIFFFWEILKQFSVNVGIWFKVNWVAVVSRRSEQEGLLWILFSKKCSLWHLSSIERGNASRCWLWWFTWRRQLSLWSPRLQWFGGNSNGRTLHYVSERIRVQIALETLNTNFTNRPLEITADSWVSSVLITVDKESFCWNVVLEHLGQWEMVFFNNPPLTMFFSHLE